MLLSARRVSFWCAICAAAGIVSPSCSLLAQPIHHPTVASCLSIKTTFPTRSPTHQCRTANRSYLPVLGSPRYSSLLAQPKNRDSDLVNREQTKDILSPPANAATKLNGVQSTNKRQKQRKERTEKPRTDEMSYWREQGDLVVAEEERVVFLIRGVPRPLRRHRTGRGFVYNPSAPYQEEFRSLVKDLLWDVPQLVSTDTPYFGGEGDDDQHLAISLVFRLRRPNSHFRSSKRGEGRLKANAPPSLAVSRTDVDNLAKFVLDSMNELLYQDDHQIVSLQATKCFDDDGSCEGSTLVSLRRLRQGDLNDMIAVIR